MKAPIKPRAIREADAAVYISMSTHYLRLGRQAVRGNRTPPPPHVKAGRRVLYLIEDLDGWLDSHRQP